MSEGDLPDVGCMCTEVNRRERDAVEQVVYTDDTREAAVGISHVEGGRIARGDTNATCPPP